MSVNQPLWTWNGLLAVIVILAVPSQSLARGHPPGTSVSGVAGPIIDSVPSPVLVGGRFTVYGQEFTGGAVVNFFVSTAQGGINEGPLIPATVTSTALAVDVPDDVILGQGVVAIQVVDTDRSYAESNIFLALLQGAASAGIPTLSAINGVGLAATSLDPRFALDNIETVVPQGSDLLLQGSGFDTVNGVAVDVFCACPGGKVGPFLIDPGDPALTDSMIALFVPSAGPLAPAVGPASFQISNRGSDGSYRRKSNAIAAVIGDTISVISVMQNGTTLTVDGTGFSSLTVINFFNAIGGRVVNLGGITSGGQPAIAITLVSDTQIQFAVPRGAVAGAAYVQAINPPFVPFSSSGNGADGAFTLVNPFATATPTAAPTTTPTATPTRIGPTATMTITATPSATPVLTEAVLLAGGENDAVTPSGEHPTLASAELYDEATGTFSATASMAYSRFGATMTGLEGGVILITGGYDGFSKRPLATAELYDAKAANFSLTGTMNTARLGHTATLLNSGKLFVSGGCNVDFSVIDIAELYESATGQFTPVAGLVDARMGHTATLLNDGQVLIAGGANDFGITSSAEICDGDGYGGCHAVGSMATARQYATATRLGDGSVLVAGGSTTGCEQCATDTAEIYNPATDSFHPTGHMHFPRSGHRASLLRDGRVLITGGLDDATGTVLDSAEIYVPASASFTLAPSMSIGRYLHTATTLSGGKVLIAGGFDSLFDVTDTAELYDPSKGIFVPTGRMTDARAGHCAASLEVNPPALLRR